MNRILIRIVAVLLTTCLVGDAFPPAGAACFENRNPVLAGEPAVFASQTLAPTARQFLEEPALDVNHAGAKQMAMEAATPFVNQSWFWTGVTATLMIVPLSITNRFWVRDVLSYHQQFNHHPVWALFDGLLFLASLVAIAPFMDPAAPARSEKSYLRASTAIALAAILMAMVDSAAWLSVAFLHHQELFTWACASTNGGFAVIHATLFLVLRQVYLESRKTTAQSRGQPLPAEVMTQSTRRREEFGIARINAAFDRMRARIELILQLFTEDPRTRDLPKPLPVTPHDSPPESAPVPGSKYTHNQLMDLGNRQLRKFGLALEPFLPLSIGSAIRAEVIEHEHPLFFELLALSVPFEFMHPLMMEALECPVEFSPRSVWDAVDRNPGTPPWIFWEKIFDGKSSRIVLDMLNFEGAWPIRTFAGLDENHKIKLLDWMAELPTELAKKLVFALAREQLVPVEYQRRIADWWKSQVTFSFSDPMTIHRHEPSYHKHEHPHELEWYFGWFYDGFTEIEQSELRAWLFTASGLYLKGYYADVAAGIAEAVYEKLSPPEKARVHEWLIGHETGLNNQYTHYHAFVLLNETLSFMSRSERDAVHRWAMEVLKDNSYRAYPDYGRQAAGLWIGNHFDDVSANQKEEFLHWFYDGPEAAIHGPLMGQSIAGTDWITPLTVQTSAFLTGERKQAFRKEWLFGPASGLRGNGYMLRLAALRILARDFTDFDEEDQASYDAWFLQYRKASAMPDRHEFYELGLYHDHSTDDWVQLYKKLDIVRQRRVMNYMRSVMGPVAYDPTQNLPMKSRDANGSRVILRYSPTEDIYWADHGQRIDFEYAVGGELFGGAKYQTNSERESAVLFMEKLYPDLQPEGQSWILTWLHAPWAGLRHYNHPTRNSASHLFIRIHREEILAHMRRAA